MNKLVVTVNDIETLKKLNEIKNIKRYIIGINKFSLRVGKTFDIEDIKEIVSIANEKKREIFVNISKIFHEEEFEEIEKILKSLKEYGVHGIIFSDLGIKILLDELKLDFIQLYSTDTTITNSSFSKMAYDNNISEIELAKELTLDEVKEINENKKTSITVFIHGHVYMYHSARKLLSNYNKEYDVKLQNSMHLFDEERNVYYPIVEENSGTHILSAKDLCGIRFVKDLEKIDFFKIDGYRYKEKDFIEIVKIYSKALEDKLEKIHLKDLEKKIKEITPYKKYDTGFFTKKTIY